MDEKEFLMSVGIRGTIFGYDAVASYELMHGKGCFRGKFNVNNGSAADLMKPIDSSLSEKFRSLLPNFLTNINAEVEFSSCYDHTLLSVNTPSMRLAVISLTDSGGKSSGSGFLCGISESDGSGVISELVNTAVSILGIDAFYLYISNGKQPVDIGRLLNPFNNSNAIIPPAAFYPKGGFCLYSEYKFSEKRSGLLDIFLGELLGVESISFFAGKSSDNLSYLILSLPELSNNLLSVKNLILKLEAGQKNAVFHVSGELYLSVVPDMTFGLSCTISRNSLMLSAAAITRDYVNLFGNFFLGDAVLTIGYNKGLTFGILGEIRIGQLYLFGAIMLAYSGALRIRLLSLATGKLALSLLIESVTGIVIPGLEMLDKIICIDYFDFRFDNQFQIEWFDKGEIDKITEFFNENVASEQLKLSEEYVSIKKEPERISAMNPTGDSTGYCLVDKYRMRHYYVDRSGKLFLRPQFYYSDVENGFSLANGMFISAGIFFCAKIVVFDKISLKALFSFRPKDGALAFGKLSEIDLGIIKITSSDYSETNPIPLPKDSILYQFLDTSQKGVAFYFQASVTETSFYFDGKISIAGILECQAQLYYQKGLVVINAESVLCGMTTQIALRADYQNFNSCRFEISLSFNTYKLEEALTKVKNRLNDAVEKCRKKINNATQSLEDAKAKVRKLYGEISNLDQKIKECKNRLGRMSWFKKIFYAPIIGCEIAGLEIAKGAIYASIYIAEAALSVAQAAVQFVGKLGEGVLKLVRGVITSVTSLFFIRSLTARLSANPEQVDMMLGIEFIALGKVYSYSWSVSKEIMKIPDKGREEISAAMLKKAEPDVRDIENGIVRSIKTDKMYTDFCMCDQQQPDISNAAKVLYCNIAMTKIVQNAYTEEFGESLPEFEEMNDRLLENIGMIEANIDVAKRAASLSELNGVVNELSTIVTEENITSGISDVKINDAAIAVEKYHKAVDISKNMDSLLKDIDLFCDDIRLNRAKRMNHSRTAMYERGTNDAQYNGSMYEYAKRIREEVENLYASSYPAGYTSPYNDSQIWETIKQTEEYFKTNG